MKKLFILMTISIFSSVQISKSQVYIITTNNTRIKADSVAITWNQVTYFDSKIKKYVFVLKSDLKGVSFENGIDLEFRINHRNNPEATYYNSVIYLLGGSFFTAFVDSISADYLVYHKFQSDSLEKIELNKILYITYVNSIRENYISKATMEEIKQIKKNTVTSVESIGSSAKLAGLNIGLNNA